MNPLTQSQARRLEHASERFDEIIAKRPLFIEDDTVLTAIVAAIDAAAALLEAGRRITVAVLNEDGRTIASAPLVLEPAVS
jgi:transcriptional regulator GlxA family with amidase domain